MRPAAPEQHRQGAAVPLAALLPTAGSGTTAQTVVPSGAPAQNRRMHALQRDVATGASRGQGRKLLVLQQSFAQLRGLGLQRD